MVNEEIRLFILRWLIIGTFFTIVLFNINAVTAVSCTDCNDSNVAAVTQDEVNAVTAQDGQSAITKVKPGPQTVPDIISKIRKIPNSKRRAIARPIAEPAMILNPGGTPDYFGTIPNYANSPLPNVVWTAGNISVKGGIRKFVDSLPRIGPTSVPGSALFGANNLGQYIPLANGSDTTTYPGSIYYEIGLVEYTEKMHSDLNATRLRGYVQLSTAKVPGKKIPLKYLNGTIITNATGAQVFAVDDPHYLGPMILADKNIPVRIKFTNYLPTNAGGNLFIPVDTTIMGAGMGYLGMAANPMNHSQNRGTIHLHGGNTPWISDGTQDQWTTPAGENTAYPKGVSTKSVPDMDGGSEPNGTISFYYTNQQGARLMFYHDHAYGITRLNVYAGVAGPYLLRDSIEAALEANGTIPGLGDNIPLVIQDKTFLPDAAQLATQDPTWRFALNASRSDLWFPSVYMPAQNPAFGPIGVNQMGRWDYGPWMVPPVTATNGPVANPLYNPATAPWEYAFNPGTPLPSMVPEAFMDTSVVNGNVYPYLDIGMKAYKFRILNAANDRAYNLQIYYASTPGPIISIVGGNGSGATAQAIVNATGSITGFTIMSPGIGYTFAPTVNISDVPGHTPVGSGATATAVVNLTIGSPNYGKVTAVNLVTGGTNYAIPTMCIGNAVLNRSLCTEVSMVPAVPGAAAFPANWNTTTGNLTNPYAILDGRDGGIPDPAAIGPNLIQIGTEGGILPAPVNISNRPIGFDYNNSFAGVLNVREKAVYLAPAERADVIVDFSGVPNNSTLILYSDTPSPATGGDSRYDYYTGAPNNTIIGGAPSTLPGYGPNTRTIMQIRINATLGTSPAFNMVNLANALPGAYAQSQDKPIVPEAAYNAAFNAAYTNTYVGFADTNITFTPAGSAASVTLNLSPKSINDGFEPTWGSLFTMQGVEIMATRTPIPYNHWDPPTEIIKNSNYAVPIGTLSDGTQIWRIYSNSVDSHPMHWHMFNVQVINRINQLTGAILPPDANELGWKETLRTNPLEDTIVALRPIKPVLPWGLPNNIRPLDVTTPLGSALPNQFQNRDPTGKTANVTNRMVNFGEEYVFHCHILGHEEMMIMRPIALVVTPNPPINLAANNASGVTLTWTDNSTNEINFTVMRAASSIGPWTTLAKLPSVTGPGTGATLTYTDLTVTGNTTYIYGVTANNVVGDTTAYAPPAVGYPTMTADSAQANITVTSGPTENLVVFVRGGDNGVWTTNLNGSVWNAWSSLGGNVSSSISSSLNTGNLNIFTRGADNGLWTKRWNGTAWSTWLGLNGTLASSPDSISLAGTTYAFVRGVDNSVWTLNWNGLSWSAWQTLGGNISSNISSASNAGNITIFARGADNGVWAQNWNGTAWGLWQGLGGNTQSDPGSVSFAGETYVFARGADNGVWMRKWNGTAWSPWQGLGGNVTSSISASSDATRLTIFARGADNGLWTQSWNGIAWSPWQGLGGTMNLDPDSVSRAGRTYVFVRGADNGVWTLNWNGIAWSPWQGLGGLIQDRPEGAFR